MTFAHPILLWVLAGAVPALALFLWWSWRERTRRITAFVPRRLIDALTVGLSPRRARLRALLLIGAVAALLLALARPRYGAGVVEVSQRGLDILVAIDTSRSMLAQDAGPGTTRLERARLAALDLAALSRSDRVGLIAFAGSAFLQCPLTIDDAAFRQSVQALDTEIIPEGGTSIAAAIQSAIDAFQQGPDAIRVLVLLTDGEEHDDAALQAARDAREAGLRIFTVGVGTARGEIIRIRDENGNESYLKDAEGNVVKSSLNEPLLQEIASMTGGLYLPLQGPQAMAELFSRGLQPLPRAELQSRMIEQYHERYQWPLALALILLAAEFVLPERARARGPARPIRRQHPAMGGAVTPTAAFLLLALLPPIHAVAGPATALRHYQRGHYRAALEEFERLASERPDDARLHFNAGTAAYRAGEFESAIRHFGNTLRTTNLELQRDAFHNLGNARFAHGEATEQLDQRLRLWEQAIESYEASLKLDPENPDTRHNLDYVRRRLEELKQQQQEQQQRRQQQQQQQDQEQQEDEQDKGSRDNESSPDDSSEPREDPSGGQQPESSPGDPQDSSREQQPEDPQSGNESGEEQSPQEPPRRDSPDGRDSQGRSGEGQQSPGATGNSSGQPGDPASSELTPQQALRLLDAAREEERPMPLERRRRRAPMLKNW